MWNGVELTSTFNSVSEEALLADEEQQVTEKRKEEQKQDKDGKESEPVDPSPP